MKIHVVLGPRQPYRAARAAFRALMEPVLVPGTQLVTEPLLGPQLWAIELAVAAEAQVHLWHGAGLRTLCGYTTSVSKDAERVLAFHRKDVPNGKKKYDPERVRDEMFAWLVEQTKKHEVRVYGFDAEAEEMPDGIETMRRAWDVKTGAYVSCW